MVCRTPHEWSLDTKLESPFVQVPVAPRRESSPTRHAAKSLVDRGPYIYGFHVCETIQTYTELSGASPVC